MAKYTLLLLGLLAVMVVFVILSSYPYVETLGVDTKSLETIGYSKFRGEDLNAQQPIHDLASLEAKLNDADVNAALKEFCSQARVLPDVGLTEQQHIAFTISSHVRDSLTFSKNMLPAGVRLPHDEILRTMQGSCLEHALLVCGCAREQGLGCELNSLRMVWPVGLSGVMQNEPIFTDVHVFSKIVFEDGFFVTIDPSLSEEEDYWLVQGRFFYSAWEKFKIEEYNGVIKNV